MKNRLNALFLTIVFVGLSGYLRPSFSEIGIFKATKNCPATTSLRANKKSQSLQVQSGASYPAVVLNKAGGEYVQVRIGQDKPALRWVALTCGTLTSSDAAPVVEPQHSGGEADAVSKPGQYLLAVSWQPAFCESPPGQNKKECETEAGFDATHFTLHGLWPQPRNNVYCNVPSKEEQADLDHRWEDLPEPRLSSQTRAELQTIMPGVQSNLHRHEWLKHGSCFGTGPEAYFRTAGALLNQLNDSRLQQFVQTHIGQSVTSEDLRTAFEQSFGRGASAALVIDCSKDKKRILISGFSINLKGSLSRSARLSDVLDTSGNAGTRCKNGIIDPVGLQ